jgi:hypothetical protein
MLGALLNTASTAKAVGATPRIWLIGSMLLHHIQQ